MSETVQSRSVYLTHFGSILRIAVAELPPGLLPNGDYSADAALAETVQFVFGAPSKHVMTHSKWDRIRIEIETRVNSKEFAGQLRSSIVAQNEAERLRFEEEISGLRSTISQLGKRVPTAADFSICMIRNAVLNRGFPMTRQLGPLLGLSGYTGEQFIIQSLYHDMRSFDETTLRLWTGAAGAALNEGVLPSAKLAFAELLEMELPFSGSLPLRPLTLEAAVMACRGCGVYVLCNAALTAAQSNPDHIATAFITAAAGIGLAVVFISFGNILPELEHAMQRGIKSLVGTRTPR